MKMYADFIPLKKKVQLTKKLVDDFNQTLIW